MSAPYMPLYVADYLADTTHLTQAETGAYLLLLMAMWRNGGSLPADDAKLARFSRSSAPHWSRIKSTLLAFFTVEDGRIYLRRLTAEIAKYEATLSQKREAGARGGKAKALKDKGTAVADAIAAPCQPEPEPEREEKKNTVAALPAPPPPEFDQLWRSATDTMRKRSSRKLSLEEWRRTTRRTSPSLLLQAMPKYRKGDPEVQRSGGPGLHIWLSQGRWENWIPQPAEPVTITPEAHERHLRHYDDTGEWRPEWGEFPKQRGAA